MKRPVSTAAGAVLVVLRVIAGVVWLVALAAQWDQVLEDDGGIDPESAEGVASYGVLGFIARVRRGRAARAAAARVRRVPRQQRRPSDRC